MTQCWRANQLYEVRYSWDGGTGDLALFVGWNTGTLQRVALATGKTGTYNRVSYESLTLGSSAGIFPCTGYTYATLPGAYDSFRLRVSDGLSGGLSSTPNEPITFISTSLPHTSKLAPDEDNGRHVSTIILCNFDNFYRGCVGVYCSNHGYNNYTAGNLLAGEPGGTSEQNISDLSFIGPHCGLYIGPNINFTISRVQSGGCRNGIIAVEGPILFFGHQRFPFCSLGRTVGTLS